MARKILLMSLAASIAATAIPTSAALAWDGDDRRYAQGWEAQRAPAYRPVQGWNQQPYGQQGWNGGGYDDGYHGVNDRRNGRVWRNSRGELRCQDPGAGGTVIGAIAGGLLGNQVAGRGNRTLGTVIGGVGGALLGRTIDKADGRPCDRFR